MSLRYTIILVLIFTLDWKCFSHDSVISLNILVLKMDFVRLQMASRLQQAKLRAFLGVNDSVRSMCFFFSETLDNCIVIILNHWEQGYISNMQYRIISVEYLLLMSGIFVAFNYLKEIKRFFN